MWTGQAVISADIRSKSNCEGKQGTETLYNYVLPVYSTILAQKVLL